MTMEKLDILPELSAEAIKTFRTVRGWSQQELASILSVGVATISRWERGTFPTGTAAAILRTLVAYTVFESGVSVLIHGEGYTIYRLLRGIFEQGTDDNISCIEG
jgi:transcriptional regulator with XRE-family HTH domain